MAATMDDRHETAERAADDLAGLLYTSGTTGRSKGAMITTVRKAGSMEKRNKARLSIIQMVYREMGKEFHDVVDVIDDLLQTRQQLAEVMKIVERVDLRDFNNRKVRWHLA